MPQLTINEEVDSQKLVFAIQVFSELVRIYGARSGELDKNGLYALLKGDFKAIFPLSGDVDVLLGVLEVTLSQLNEDAPQLKITSIDYRFKNPVLKLK